MKKTYRVKRVEGFDGLEVLGEPNVGRHIYQPGETVELDSRVSDVAALVAGGFVEPADPVKPEKPGGE